LADYLVYRLDNLTTEILKEQTEIRDLMVTRRTEFENQRTGCDNRIRVIKTFGERVHNFLSDAKHELIKMITTFDMDESERNPELGPVLPADDVTIESFDDLAGTFLTVCERLMLNVSNHWQKKCTAHLKSHAEKLEAYLIQSTKSRETLSQEN
jgi:hypothetical protein